MNLKNIQLIHLQSYSPRVLSNLTSKQEYHFLSDIGPFITVVISFGNTDSNVERKNININIQSVYNDLCSDNIPLITSVKVLS